MINLWIFQIVWIIVETVQTVPKDLKKLSNVADVKNTKFNTLKIKVNNLKKKITDVTTLIYINQYNKDKHNLEKKHWKCW